jgi:hypothetical protein
MKDFLWAPAKLLGKFSEVFASRHYDALAVK